MRDENLRLLLVLLDFLLDDEAEALGGRPESDTGDRSENRDDCPACECWLGCLVLLASLPLDYGSEDLAAETASAEKIAGSVAVVVAKKKKKDAAFVVVAGIADFVVVVAIIVVVAVVAAFVVLVVAV